jgi:hypothetical protein
MSAAYDEKQPLPPTLTLGGGEVGGRQLGPLRDSAGLPHEALRQQFEEDGYIYLRGLLPRRVVEAGYAAARAQLEAEQLWPGVKFSAAWRECPEVMAVAEAPELKQVCTALFQGSEPASYPFKWLRTSQPGGSTGFHCDSVWMGRGSQRLVTAWVPLEDTPVDLGGLAVLERSHSLAGFERLRQTYVAHDVQRSEARGSTGSSGIYSADPAELLAFDPEARFLTANYLAGDVLLFKAMGIFHGAVQNTTDRTRLSMDVRWQPLSDPWDDRYISGGDSLHGVEYRSDGETALIDYAALEGTNRHPEGADGTLTFDELKALWGLKPASGGKPGTARL